MHRSKVWIKERIVPSKEQPLYQRIYEDIKTAINDGVYPPESKIPTETELSETYSVAVSPCAALSRTSATMGTLSSAAGWGRLFAHHA